jgi:hypothetical protein
MKKNRTIPSEKKNILSYVVDHDKKDGLHYFWWNWSMIWVLVKYRLWLNMKITFTVIKAYDREEYYVQFFAE